jgi:uncharacterized lipoprotein YmbA
MIRIESLTTLGICSLIVILAGCGSSASVRYYALSPDGAVEQMSADPEIIIVIGPVRVAEYLNRPQIVTLDGGTRAVPPW